MTSPILLAVPNVSEGRDEDAIEAIGQAFVDGPGASGGSMPQTETLGRPSGGVRLLDVHSDGDHHRSVFTLLGRQGELADALLSGARAAVGRIDVVSPGDVPPSPRRHPHVGAIDVVPIVYLEAGARGAACAEALVVAERIGQELAVPVFLYGELAGDRQGATRAQLRRGGVAALAERMLRPRAAEGAAEADFGPRQMHVSAGAALVAAREPLVAFNLQLEPSETVEDARGVAALVRDGGTDGLPGLRAIGVELSGGIAQVSMNVERPLEVPLARVIEVVGRHARIASAELVGLAPRAAFAGFPEDLPLPGFDPARHLIENALGS